jgi:hypothetical protein
VWRKEDSYFGFVVWHAELIPNKSLDGYLRARLIKTVYTYRVHRVLPAILARIFTRLPHNSLVALTYKRY